MTVQTAVLDLGGSSCKLGLNSDTEPRIIPNCVSKAKNERRKVYFGDQLNECKDFSGLFYVLPFQKGYLVNWDVQRQLFDFMFSKESLKVDSSEANLVITEPVFNFTSIKECLDEIMFEEHQFKALSRNRAAELVNIKHISENNSSKPLCTLVVDSGFSFTHVIPVCQGEILKNAVKRIDVGGKVMTNYLKEIISYRQLHVLDETYVMNQVKEDCCFVSTDFNHDMEITKQKRKLNTIARDYILPDYTNVKRGFIRPLEEMLTKYTGTEQLLKMNNERFTVPELLFHPSDVGIQQMGIPEAIHESVKSTDILQQPHFYKNIVLVGGNTALPGFNRRALSEVRKTCPDDFDLNIVSPNNPAGYAWQGGVELSKKHDFISNFCVTKKEYEESGKNICMQKFDKIEK